MTASAGAWYRVGTVNVTNNNQSVVGVDTNWQNDVIAIAVGDFFTLDAKTWYEVIAVNSDTSITLDRGFEGSTGTNKTYAIVRNTSGTILTRIAGQVSVQFNQKQLFLDELRTWLNSSNATEELTDSHGLKQSLKTPSQMVRDHDNKLAELDVIHPHPYAMRKVEFEANRKKNNEKFAASGFVHFGKHRANGNSIFKINEGMYTYIGVGAENTVSIGDLSTSALGVSKSKAAQVNISGVISTIQQTQGWGAMNIRFPHAEDGTRTYDSSTGISVTHASPAIAFASETETNKVVTDRVDMWGFEAFLREINDSDPFVYANGLIQSLASDISGVTTVSDTVRPITYFAWYEGDTESRGRGVNWQTASEAQRINIASDPANNIYFDDVTGKFYQWCIRGRSFAGAGNGDWDNVDATGTSFLTARAEQGVSRYINPVGIKEEVTSYRSSWPVYRATEGNLGAYKVQANNSGALSTDTSVGGECYFLVCGTVNRLNKGAYHPSFNPSGAAKNRNSSGSWLFWYNSSDQKNNSTADCFRVFPFNVGGNIGTESGRPDGRFYDAIYASGQGGVCRDMRYSAWGLTQEDFAEADLKVKSGKYHGFEKLKYTKFTTFTNTRPTQYDAFGINGQFTRIGLLSNVAQSSRFANISAIRGLDGTWYLVQKVETGLSDNYIIAYLDESYGNVRANFNTTNPMLLQTIDLPTSTGGSFLQTDVIGDPANILQIDALKDGWEGSWIPKIPDGTGREPITRKAIASTSTIPLTYTSNNGVSWSNISYGFNNITNDANAIGLNLVGLLQYQAFAKQTEPAANAVVYGGVDGIGDVFASSDPSTTYGCLFNETLLGNINTSAATPEKEGVNNKKMVSIAMLEAGQLFSTNLSVGINQHSQLTIGEPSNNSTSFKTLDYNVSINQQAFKQYAATELKHNGTDWGDDGKIHITNNQSTMLDTNGNTVKVGTARIVEPLGWIKNDK